MSAKLEVDVVAKVKDFAAGLKEAGKETDNLGNKIDSSNKKSAQSTKALSDAIGMMKSGFTDALSSVVPFSSQLASMGTMLGGVSGGMKGVTGASKLLKTALISTGIGAIVVALGSLVAYLTTTQAGMDKLRQFTEPVAQIFQRLLGVLQNLGGNVFKGIAQMLNGDLKEGFKTLASGAKQAGQEVAKSFKGGIEAGKELARLTVKIEEAQNDLILTEGRLNREIAEQSELALQIQKGEKVTQAAAKKAIELINQRTAAQNGLLDLEIKKMKLEQEANDTQRQGYGELNKLIAQREQNEANGAKERKRLNAKANSEIITDFKETVKILKDEVGEFSKSFETEMMIEISAAFVLDSKDLFSKIDKTIKGKEAVKFDDIVVEFTPVAEMADVDTSKATQKLLAFKDSAIQLSQQANQALSQGATDGIAALAGAIGASLAGGSNAFAGFGQMLLGTLAGIMSELGKAAIGIGITMKAIKTSFKNPGTAIAAGIALVAVSKFISTKVAGMVSGGGGGGGGKPQGLTPFANGGIVSGPTPALVGEYTGAKTNPEVIAPLNKLQNMMGGNVNFVISGDNLVGTLNRANKTRSRKF
jgi:hypothetical protein